MRLRGKKSGDELIGVLIILIQSCERGETGFRRAAGSVDDSALRSIMSEYARERRMFAQELHGCIRKLCSQPKEDVLELNDLGWLQLTKAIEKKDTTAIVSELCRAEETTSVDYENAFKMDLPSAVLSTIERQYSHIRQAIHYLRSIEIQSRGINT